MDNIHSLRAHSHFLLTVPAVVCEVNIACVYFKTSSGITIGEGSGFNSSVSHSVPRNHDNNIIIPFMGSCGSSSMTSGITGDGGGLFPSSGSTSNSAVKTSVPGSAGRLGPGDFRKVQNSLITALHMKIY